jgi:hypothetical protein
MTVAIRDFCFPGNKIYSSPYVLLMVIATAQAAGQDAPLSPLPESIHAPQWQGYDSTLL